MYSHYLETFICAADAGSFAKAGESLFITATAVMKQINQMEKQLGVLLFDRTPKGLVLTAAGESYYRDAKYMIRYAEEAKERAQKVMQKSRHIIRIGMSALNTNEMILQLWPRIRELDSNFQLEVVHFENSEQNAREILRNLGVSIDVVVAPFDPTLLKLRECDATEFCKISPCCAVPAYHPIAQLERITFEDLHGEELMLIREGWSQTTDELRRYIQSRHPKIRICDFPTYTVEVFNECVNRDIVLLNLDWKSIHPLVRNIPLDWPHTMSFGLMHAHNPAPEVKLFVRLAKQAYLEKQHEEH